MTWSSKASAIVVLGPGFALVSRGKHAIMQSWSDSVHKR